MKFARLSTVLLLLSLAACGGSSPTAPSIPQVAGNYGGTVTFTFPGVGTVSCVATTSVTQSGSEVNVAPIAMGSPCNLSIPVGTATIDATGAFQGSTSGTVPETCGVYNMVGSGGFFGNQLQFSIIASSNTCVNFTFAATLNRA
jgi:hypothetical protein